MRVLIADDSAISRHMLRTALTMWEYEVVEARDGREAMEILDAMDSPQLAILDWHMPALDGPGICHRLRSRPNHPYVYVILLTVRGERESLLAGLRSGADDYLVKPFDQEVLQQRLRAGVRILELQDRLLSVQETLRIQATRDPLTNILNRTAVIDALTRELDRSRRTQSPLGLVMVDVDRFKRVNDAHGHAIGDAVLRQLASEITSELRVYDHVGRYGGDEFLIVLPGSNVSESVRAGNRFREKIASKRIEIPGLSLQVTMSIGVSALEEIGTVIAEDLIRRADKAMDRAKIEGRNRVCAEDQVTAAHIDGAVGQIGQFILT